MLNIKVEGADKFKELFSTNLIERATAMTRYMLRTVVESVYDTIKRAIPETEEWLKVYKKNLEIYEIRKKDLRQNEFGFVIGARISGDWSMVDASTMLVYFEALQASEDFEVGEILQKYSPFTVDTVPNLPVYGAKTSIRRVRQDEIDAVRTDNQKQRASLASSLAVQGVKMRDGQATIEGTIYFDMVFMVLRMEQRLGDIKKPHWRPALREIKARISEMQRDRKTEKVIEGFFEPGSVEWKKDAENKYPPIRLKDLDKIERFHKKIMGVNAIEE